MPKMEVNVPKRWAYAVLILALFGSGLFAVWAYNANYPTAGKPVGDVVKVGHSPDEIEVDLGGAGTGTCEGKRTLQYAIANKCLGAGTTTQTTSGGFTNMVIFELLGTQPWTKPQGVTKFMVEVWGGGGGGGGGAVSPIPCVGGGGGGYGREIFTVPADAATYNLYVGAGGKSGYRESSNSALLATNGEDSTITVGSRTIRAEGGDAPTTGNIRVPFGGRGGAGVAQFSLRGGNGRAVIGDTAWDIGSGVFLPVAFTQGGSGALGGEGAISYGGSTSAFEMSGYGTPVYAAEVPGGGGACGYDSSQTPVFRQLGADGRIVIWW